MPRVAILGGGLAGLAAAAALGASGFDADVYEARPFLGGRATSYPLPDSESGELVDNCQHVLLRCCVNLLDFYRRLGVGQSIEFHKRFFFIEPGGRMSMLAAGSLPAPLHMAGSFLRLRFLGWADKIAIGRALRAIRRERRTRSDLDRIAMLDWLREKRQTARAIDRFWRPVLVSAINEELDRMAATHAFQVFALGFLGGANTYEMGIPSVPLSQLYRAEAWSKLPRVRIHHRSPVERITPVDGRVVARLAGGEAIDAGFLVSALPFERLGAVGGDLGLDLSSFTHSPITGIHLWFNRPVTDLPHAALLDRTIQWMFNKDSGRYLLLVVSASRSLTPMPRADVIALAVRELAEFLPTVRKATLDRAHVIKEVRATYSAGPGLEEHRPAAATQWPNFFLAGDWTRCGWPATMEGAVRSGYLAAEAVCQAAGSPHSFLLPDVA